MMPWTTRSGKEEIAMRPITAADLMNPKVLAVREDMTLRELAAYLIHHQISGAPVEDGGGRLVGVVSTVDIAEAMLADADADADDTAGDAAGADLGAGPGAAAAEVGGNAGEPLDALDALDEEDEPDLPEDDVLVRDIMTPAIDSVPEDATVSEVASRMLDSHVHRLLVTRDGRPVGIITTSDLLGLLIDE
jgi:CBS domain-containing protein